MPSTTGSIALRDAEVQPPNTAATLSSVSSLLIFSAKTVGSLWPSSSMTSIFLPRMPPPVLISSTAISSESRTVCSLIAITPDVELSRPSSTVSPSTQVSPDGVDPPAAAAVVAVDPAVVGAADAAVVSLLDELSDPHAVASSDSEMAAPTSNGFRRWAFLIMCSPRRHTGGWGSV